MKRYLTSIFFVFVPLMFIHAQENKTEQQTATQAEFEAAAKAYKTGNYAEAQQHAERALAIDPTNKQAMIFVARTIHAQYRPGNETPENTARAYNAIAAYQRVILNEPTNEESYKAVTALYGSVKEEELQRQWISQWANNPMVDEKKRAEAFIQLATKDHKCSLAITDANRKFGGKKNVKFIWIKPKEPHDYETAKQCATDGLSEIEQAINLAPYSETVWEYKAALLAEMSKFAEMNGDKVLRDDYRNQENLARRKLYDLWNLNRQQSFSKINGGMLNGAAISLPQPQYPEAARKAKVSGTVVVSAIIDEEGNVSEAIAVAGNVLLRDAAVEAAKQAKFHPTTLSGVPVKVTGNLVYNFKNK